MVLRREPILPAPAGTGPPRPLAGRAGLGLGAEMDRDRTGAHDLEDHDAGPVRLRNQEQVPRAPLAVANLVDVHWIQKCSVALVVQPRQGEVASRLVEEIDLDEGRPGADLAVEAGLGGAGWVRGRPVAD